MNKTKVAFETTTTHSFEEAVARCRKALTAESFGVLTEVDIRATLKKKLDVDREPYVILGACHPPSAHRALTEVPEIGVLLPCNVTVSIENGDTVVRAMNPHGVLDLLDHPAVDEVAQEVGAALERVVRAVET